MSAITDRLDEWAALAAAATPITWEVDPSRAAVWNASPDAAFIAASRTALPAFIEALRAVLYEHHSVPVYLLADECGHVEDEHEIMESDTGDNLCIGSPTGEFQCGTCRDDEGYHGPWPCPTVDAIATALGVTP